MAKQNHSVSGAKSVDYNNTQCTSDMSLTSNKDGQPSDGHSRSCSQQSPADTPTLNVKIDDDVSPELKTVVVDWLEEVCQWHLDQPRRADLEGCFPQYDQLAFTIGMNRLGRGLRHRVTGKGWVNLRVTNWMTIETKPNPIREYVSDVSISSRTNWAYLLSQHFGCESFDDPEFKQQEHLDFQLRYLEHISPDLANNIKKKIRLEGVKRRNAARRNKKPVSPTTSSRPTKPQQNQDSWFCPPMNPRQVPTPKTVTTLAPTPELSQYQQQIIEEHKRMWDYIKSDSDSCDSTCSATEDYDK